MRQYEVMVIFDTGAEPPAIQAVVDRLLASIQAHDGAPGTVDRWGRRPFAYEVRHRREGYYVLVEFGGEPQTVSEVDRLLSLADEVLRHRVIRIPDEALARPSTGRAAARSTGRSTARSAPKAPTAEAVGSAPGTPD
ncbi:MAG: 30S ribosomal protein S6 [Actinomycetota bacterium]|jgi:small subunit ribosomal protein S6|nr:30S ribosomal protein S6 [Actinomycetota bacterium]